MSDALRGGTTGQDDRDAGGSPTTGTLAPAGADAGQTSVEAELRAENARLKEAHEKALAEKTTLEATKRENEALKARLSAPPTGAGAGGPDPRLVRLQQHAMAAQADPGSDSALVVGLYSENQALARQINELRGLISVPADQQAQVRDLQQEYFNRGENISAETARRILKAEKLEAEATKVSATAREQEALEDAKRRSVVATRTVGVSRAEVEGKTMTMADYEAKTAGMTGSEAREYAAKLAASGTVVLPD